MMCDIFGKGTFFLNYELRIKNYEKRLYQKQNFLPLSSQRIFHKEHKGVNINVFYFVFFVVKHSFKTASSLVRHWGN